MALDWLLHPIFVLFILIFILNFAYSSPISESESLITFKKSLTNSTALSSWEPGSAPCSGKTKWIGVLCSRDTVIGLRLENMGLSGKIDVDALVNISGLRSLSFAHNSFSGSLPELNRLGYLKSIYLTGNQFSGEIPSYFFSEMEMLKKLWLPNNKFYGEIPSSLMHLSNLIELHMENNQFTGNIPYINHTKLKSFNVSNNYLRGQIPSGLSKFSSSSFEGNSGLCGDVIGIKCNATPTVSSNLYGLENVPNEDNSQSSIRARGAGLITLAAMVISVAGVIFLRMRNPKEKNFIPNVKKSKTDEAGEVQVAMPNRQSDEMEVIRSAESSGGGFSNSKNSSGELIMVNDEKGTFRLVDLMKASAEVLGNGGLGSSYKVVMANGMFVVVKRMRDMNALGKDAFGAEIRKLASLCHPNILGPLAFHYRKEEKLLIYEFMPKGSLFHMLHGDRGQLLAELNWPTRFKIIQGIAKGLGYLHNELDSSNLPHGNLKSTNIFINSKNEPLISEFGFNPLTNPSVAKQTLMAYKAPEAATSGVSPKCDVYCLGVIILELITGNHPSLYHNNDRGGGIDIVNWVEKTIAEGKGSGLLDPEIAVSSNSIGEMKLLLEIGVHCANSNLAQRLELREAIQRIEEVKEESDAIVAKTMQGQPSLRDGYADAPPIDWSSTVRQGSAANSRRETLSGSLDSSQFSFHSLNSNFEH